MKGFTWNSKAVLQFFQKNRWTALLLLVGLALLLWPADGTGDNNTPAATEQRQQYAYDLESLEEKLAKCPAAALLAGLLNGQNLETAAQTAAYFTSRCIQRTAEAQVPEREGLCFEKELLWLGSRLQNLNNDTDNYTK